MDSTESPVNISFEIQPISHHKSSILKCLFWPTSLELYIAAYLTKIHQQMPEICKNHFCLEKFGQIWRENDAKSWGQELTCSVLLFCTNEMFFSSAFITLYWQTFVIGIVFLVSSCQLVFSTKFNYLAIGPNLIRVNVIFLKLFCGLKSQLNFFKLLNFAFYLHLVFTIAPGLSWKKMLWNNVAKHRIDPKSFLGDAFSK